MTLSTKQKVNKKPTTTHLSLLKLSFNFADEPVKGLVGESELLDDTLGAECGSDEHLHENGGVLIGLHRQLVLPWHNRESPTQVLHICQYNKEEL